jgi:O-acetylserine/cysteine efflux transporter
VVTALLETGQWQAVQTAGVIEWATLAFVAIVGFYIAYIAWYSLLRLVRMDEAAPFILLMTPIGLLTAVIVLGERMSLVQIIGATVLLIGLAIVNGIGARKTRLA